MDCYQEDWSIAPLCTRGCLCTRRWLGCLSMRKPQHASHASTNRALDRSRHASMLLITLQACVRHEHTRCYIPRSPQRISNVNRLNMTERTAQRLSGSALSDRQHCTPLTVQWRLHHDLEPTSRAGECFRKGSLLITYPLTAYSSLQSGSRLPGASARQNEVEAYAG